MDKQCIRAYIKTRFLLGFNATQIHEELHAVYGECSPSYRTIAHWVHRFSTGRDSLEDDPRSGRPITAITEQNIASAKELVNTDPHISIDLIAEVLDISHGSVDTILKQHLQLKKVSSRWVPHELTPEQRQKRIDICQENLRKFESGEWRLCDVVTGDETWIYYRNIESKQKSRAWVGQDEAPPTVVKRQQFDKKSMFVVFFMTTGPLLIHQVPTGTTIDALYYRNECLTRLIEKLHKKRPTSTTHAVKLHHDNARPHVKDIVIDYLHDQKIKLIHHPPYSPDIAPCDFWLFGYLKGRLESYSDPTSLAKAVTKELNSIPIDEYRKTFHKWIERMRLCIENQENYFEHLM
jgi:[histone H3]-lysine36 N-dimethyltransferase SETMAR